MTKVGPYHVVSSARSHAFRGPGAHFSCSTRLVAPAMPEVVALQVGQTSRHAEGLAWGTSRKGRGA